MSEDVPPIETDDGTDGDDSEAGDLPEEGLARVMQIVGPDFPMRLLPDLAEMFA